LSLLESLEPLIAEVEEELARLSGTAPWLSQVVFLLQIPGIGVINALVLLAAIGDITRFPTAKQLVGYAGLGASVHASGETYQTGHITRQGRKEIRAALVESAWMAVEHHSYWKAQFERLSSRIGKKKAIVAIARKLLVTSQRPDAISLLVLSKLWPCLAFPKEASNNSQTLATARIKCHPRNPPRVM
jgi:transposase